MKALISIFIFLVFLLSGCGTTTGNALVHVSVGIGTANFELAPVRADTLEFSSYTFAICVTSVQLVPSTPTAPTISAAISSGVVSLSATPSSLSDIDVPAGSYSQALLGLSACAGRPSLDYDDSSRGKHFSSTHSLTLTFDGPYDLGGGDSVYFDLSTVKDALDNDADPSGDITSIVENAKGKGKQSKASNGNGKNKD
jgi:hypothetical protein